MDLVSLKRNQKRRKREKKKKMSDDELFEDYQNSLEENMKCPNPSCNCLEVLKSIDVRVPVAKYLAWFARFSYM